MWIVFLLWSYWTYWICETGDKRQQVVSFSVKENNPGMHLGILSVDWGAFFGLLRSEKSQTKSQLPFLGHIDAEKRIIYFFFHKHAFYHLSQHFKNLEKKSKTYSSEFNLSIKMVVYWFQFICTDESSWCEASWMHRQHDIIQLNTRSFHFVSCIHSRMFCLYIIYPSPSEYVLSNTMPYKSTDNLPICFVTSG